MYPVGSEGRVYNPTEEEPAQATAGQFPWLKNPLQLRRLPPWLPHCGSWPLQPSPQGGHSHLLALFPWGKLFVQALSSEPGASGVTSSIHPAKH